MVVEEEPPPDVLEDLELILPTTCWDCTRPPVAAESFSYRRPAAPAHRHLSRTDLTSLRNR